MLIIDRKFIERYCSEYNRRTQGTYDQNEEEAILNWVSTQSQPRFLNKKYFIRLGRWKTSRYQKTREKNDEKDIKEITRASYLAKDDLEKLNILKGLKGIGVAVASTILYYLEPDKFAIFDYHVRNTLKKAGKLSKEKEGSSKKIWLEYIRVVRKLSRLYNKTIREVEKALFAYDKWGHRDDNAEHSQMEGRMDKNNGLEITLPPEKMDLLKRVAEDEFGIEASTLAQIWITERLQPYRHQSSINFPLSNVEEAEIPAKEEVSAMQGREKSSDTVTKDQVRRIKQDLADKFIEDQDEKRLFLLTSDGDIHDWGCYIAGLVLTQDGKETFGKSDIILELRRLTPQIYDKKYAKKNRIQPPDVRIDAPRSNKDEHTGKFPCLEKVGSGKYRFVGFKEGIRKRYGDDTLQKRLFH